MQSAFITTVIICFSVTPSKSASSLRHLQDEAFSIVAAPTGWTSFTYPFREKLDQLVAASPAARPTPVLKKTAQGFESKNEIYLQKDLAKNLRISPKMYAALTEYYHRLDADGNGGLHEVEFAAAADGKNANLEARDIFDYFAPSGTMTVQEFLRFSMCAVAKDSDFHWSDEDLKHLPTWKVWQDQDRAALMKLFIVFDVDSDGGVTMVEFENIWMGPLLWKLRREDVISSAWMTTDEEFQYANRVFDKRSGEDMVLDLTEFVHLLYEARKKGAGEKFNSGSFGQYRMGVVSVLGSIVPFV